MTPARRDREQLNPLIPKDYLDTYKEEVVILVQISVSLILVNT